MSFAAIAVGVGVAGIGVGLYESNKANQTAGNALTEQENLINSLSPYSPIDINQLQATATQDSIQNAKNSLALQTQLQPNVVASNNELAKSVADQLKLGGQLSPDQINSATLAGRTAGASSGSFGSSAPLTATLLGQDSNALLQQRQNAAETLSAANPAPTVGLDPGTLANVTVANSNALNQYNLSKAGLGSNLINSTAQVNAGTLGTNSASINTILNALKGLSPSGTASNTPALGSSPVTNAQINQPSGFSSAAGLVNGAGVSTNSLF